MKDVIKINQGSARGSENTNIAVQNNYIGMSPEEASSLAINLFMENFPKLQQQAMDKVEERISAFCDTVMQKLAEENINDYSPFTEPDVQYALYEAQNNYARFGTDEMLSTLSGLITERVKMNQEDFSLKVTIDKAISIAGMLSVEQLNYLSLLFIVTKVKVSNIKTIEKLEEHFKIIEEAFGNIRESDWQYLQMLGCLQLELPQVCKNYSQMYGLDIKDIERICPEKIKGIGGDYSTSPLGTILAIVNAKDKVPYHFDPRVWIHN